MSQPQVLQTEPEPVMTQMEAAYLALLKERRIMRGITWTYGKDSKRTIFLQSTRCGVFAAICCENFGNEETERLASLFAASGDLLEACEQSLLMWSSISTSVDPDEVCAMLQATIDKAKRK